MAYSDLHHIFTGVFMNSIQALLAVFLFSFIVFKEKFIPNYILYSFLIGSICSLFEGTANIFLPHIGRTISNIFTILLYFIVFKCIFQFKLLKCGTSLFITMLLYIGSSLCASALLSVLKVKELFSEVNTYAIACFITFALYILQLLLIKILNLSLELPLPVKKGVFVSNITLMTVTVIIITCNMNYFVCMHKVEDKWILIANCAAVLYLIYANVNSKIALFKYKKLMDQYVATVGELAVVNERNRFARDAHDTIGYTMSRIVALLEKCRDTYDNTDASVQQMLTNVVEYARDGFQELRRSIIGMVPEKLESEDLENALKRLFSGFNVLGIKINFTMKGKFNGSLKLSNTVYKICQEALSNLILHGNAENVTVALHIEKKLELYICDDGAGCETFKKGFGISGMEQRVKELGGQLECDPSEGKGFRIHARLPHC